MDECVVFCEVWGLTEYLILGVLILGPIIGAVYGVYNDGDFDDVVAAGIGGLLVSFVLVLSFAIWQIILSIILLAIGLPAGVWFISKGIKGLRK